LSHDWIADDKLFALLDAEDARVTAKTKAAGCLRCGGRLDRANYPRKPRGGSVGAAGERLDRRRSLCCARTGCRSRATPPSLVFLGRRVYLAVVVVVEAWRAMASPAAPTPGTPRRTVGRWLAWFRSALPRTAWFATVRARLSPPLEPNEELPAALLVRLPGDSLDARLLAALRLLSPASTAPR
jgi:hypothetical protein